MEGVEINKRVKIKPARQFPGGTKWQVVKARD